MTAAPPALCRRTAALTVAAMAGVVVVLATWLVRDAIGAGPGPVGGLAQLLQLSMLMLVVGWCIAVPVCLMIGLPLWHFAIRSDRQRHRDALRFGLIAGGVIGAVMAIIGDPVPAGMTNRSTFSAIASPGCAPDRSPIASAILDKRYGLSCATRIGDRAL